MNYIFKDGNEWGIFPIEKFQVCFYDMIKDGKCFDENFIYPKEFSVEDLIYIDTEENEKDFDRSRVFVHHLNGDIYELKLHKLSKNMKKNNFYSKDT